MKHFCSTSVISYSIAFRSSKIAVSFDFQGIGLDKLLFYDYIMPKINIVRKEIAVRFSFKLIFSLTVLLQLV